MKYITRFNNVTDYESVIKGKVVNPLLMAMKHTDLCYQSTIVQVR